MDDTKGFVLDGSVTMSWYFKDEANDYADAVRESLIDGWAVVPSVWPLEIANTLVVGERRKRSTPAQASAWLALLKAFPVSVDDETSSHAWDRTLDLARTHALSAYDAAYLELAMRRGLPLATLDAKLKAASIAVGVPIFAG